LPTQILISSDPWENRVAVLEDGQLAEIYFEREEKVIGSIYKGRIQNVLASMGASFVDIGLGRNAFLYVDDINKTPLNIGNVEITQGRSGYTIGEKVSKGDDVLVQIVKEPRGLKGARVSTNISLPGRYLTLMPTGRYSGVSRKIGDAAERERLKNIVKRIRPEGMATIVRTAATGVSDAELIADLGVLLRMWHGILETYKIAAAPSLIHKDMNLVYKAARDFVTAAVEKVYIDDAEEYHNVRDFLRLLGPQYVERVEHYNNGRSLFADFKIDEEVNKLMRPRVNLPSGGSIIIETTDALTVIDINSGNTGGRHLEDTILRTNLDAAAEIARQVRLRDIGGIIVCDFIDMASETARNKVLKVLEDGLRRDRTRTTIQSFSALGLLEFTRKRVGKDLSQQLRDSCPTCNGLGSVLSPDTIAIDTLRRLRATGHIHDNGASAKTKPPKQYEVVAAPTVGAELDFWYEDELVKLEESLGTKVRVRIDQAIHPERTVIESLDGKSAQLKLPRVGDEIDVALLSMRLPNPISALAVYEGTLIEVEGGAPAIGRTIRIKVIDVDDDGNVLAEPRIPLEQEIERSHRRRAGRGRRKSELSAAEQADELLELAEEAAKGVEARPAIGISTESEAQAEEEVLRAHHIDDASTSDAEQKRRRRRRRGRGGRGRDENGNGQPAAAIAGPAAEPAADPGADPVASAASEVQPAAAGDSQPGGTLEEGQRRRRRRRRRGGRGRGQLSENGRENASPESGATPERTVFRAGANGVERTSEVAPPEPPRAIQRRIEQPLAVEPPPPVLRVAREEDKIAKPTRRRVTPKAGVEPRLSTEPVAALPAPAPEPAKRVARIRKAAAEPASAPAAAGEPAPEPATEKAASRRRISGAAAPAKPKTTPAGAAAKPKTASAARPKAATKPAAGKAVAKPLAGKAAAKAATVKATAKPAAGKAAAKPPAGKAAAKAATVKTTAKPAAGKAVAKPPAGKAAAKAATAKATAKPAAGKAAAKPAPRGPSAAKTPKASKGAAGTKSPTRRKKTSE
jgi:ribonuclease G